MSRSAGTILVIISSSVGTSEQLQEYCNNKNDKNYEKKSF